MKTHSNVHGPETRSVQAKDLRECGSVESKTCAHCRKRLPAWILILTYNGACCGLSFMSLDTVNRRINRMLEVAIHSTVNMKMCQAFSAIINIFEHNITIYLKSSSGILTNETDKYTKSLSHMTNAGPLNLLPMSQVCERSGCKRVTLFWRPRQSVSSDNLWKAMSPPSLNLAWG